VQGQTPRHWKETMISRKLTRAFAPLVVTAGLALGVTPAAQAAAKPVTEHATKAATTCTTSAQFGLCSYAPYAVNQDEWNPATGSTQELTATSNNDWSVTTSQPAGAYVRTYPDISEELPGLPYSDYSTAVQTFTDSVSFTSGTGETAADLWLNGTPGTSDFSAATVEIMVWTDNNGRTPAGTDTTTATINGQNFQVWECNTSGCVNSLGHVFFAFVLEGNETSGQIHDVDTINWLISNGLLSASLPFNQIDYGAEFGSLTQTSAGTLSFTTYNNFLVPSS
jgi:Glycosyl hydrolase family 12